jgi:poly(A) polymerase
MGDGEPRVNRAAENPAFDPLARAAAEIGAAAWVVGGYVRDTLLGRDHPDLDVVVEDGQGLELARHFAKITGSPEPVLFERFGTAQVRFGDRLVEFASTRAESYERDSRKPVVRPATLEEDLRRRDFTINTLLMDFEGEVHDATGRGLADLKAKLLRTPLDPVQTFDDDPLRMLRGIRFAAELGFRLDPPLMPAMRKLRERLRPPVLSVERTADELRKMLLSDRPREALELMDEAGLLEIVLPEVAACKGVEQGGWHTHDVFGHTLLTVEKAKKDELVRLAALLHDIGKPVTANDGAFIGHDVEGARLAAEALRRLRFSNALADKVARLVRLHLRPVFYDGKQWKDGAVRKLARDAGDLLWPLMDLARADIAASAYPDAEKLDELEARLKDVLAERPSRFRLPIQGGDIMRVRGLKQGPEVGRIKKRLQELLLEGAIEPDRAAVLAYLEAHPEL